MHSGEFQSVRKSSLSESEVTRRIGVMQYSEARNAIPYAAMTVAVAVPVWSIGAVERVPPQVSLTTPFDASCCARKQWIALCI